MRSTNGPDGRRSGRSFLEEARRTQIVTCAIDVLAGEGFAHATLARIAERAGISKSVIVYHFGGKDEVLGAVAAEVVRAATEALVPRIEAETTVAGRLRTYIEERVGFLATHRNHMLALFEIWTNLRGEGGRLRFGEADAKGTVEAIERMLRAGQRSGEFGKFSVPVMAMAIRQAIDGVLLQIRFRPDLNVRTYARELADLFERATRRQV